MPFSRRAIAAPIMRKGFQNRAEYGLTHLYCSLMERAVQTGSIIASILDVPLFGVPDLHEVGGIYYDEVIDGVSSIRIEHGLTPAYLKRTYPGSNCWNLSLTRAGGRAAGRSGPRACRARSECWTYCLPGTATQRIGSG